MGLGQGEPNLWEMILPANIVNVIVITFMVVAVAIYYKRRQHFPIKGRGSHAILLVALINIITLLSLAVRGPYIPCVIDLMVYIGCSHCGSGLYVYRVAVLLARHERANTITFQHSTRDLLQRQQGPHSCSKYCNILDTKRWNIVLLIYSLTLFFAVLCIAAAVGEHWTCEQSVITLVSNAFLILTLVPLLTYMGCKLRKYPSDGRHISTEFRFVSVFMCLSLVIYTAISQATDIPYSSIYFLDAVAIGLVCASMYYPIYLTYRYQRRSRSAASPSARGSLSSSIEALLANEEFRMAFLAHLKLEFNVESLIFWQTVSIFKKNQNRPPEEIIEEITEIMDTFVGRNAPYQLNVSDESVALTRATVQQAKDSKVGLLDVFDSVMIEVVTLMKSDPFPRFLRTPAGREFIMRKEEVSPTSSGQSKYALLPPDLSPVSASESV